jgi:hypothetical protein
MAAACLAAECYLIYHYIALNARKRFFNVNFMKKFYMYHSCDPNGNQADEPLGLSRVHLRIMIEYLKKGKLKNGKDANGRNKFTKEDIAAMEDALLMDQKDVLDERVRKQFMLLMQDPIFDVGTLDSLRPDPLFMDDPGFNDRLNEIEEEERNQDLNSEIRKMPYGYL